ncbi:WD40 repeat protein/energy-coupling factor transporter ATP-binding protein EcfA2 [Streptomyces umbrinus]|uniref:WD40 repeat protein/energy-coupling factor transporter ATP-binding protein EcfA2 n=1 Tax=Streptomyces umbrinus TaxID=67370 RepID=A0ABU0SMU4_9ACTN|nr:AAA family ATPase [Streptomyces umbrinus]MDQ1024792.1 WD40 repeat protein/energy-coupling factor transporter ATP-binding protein EcfA2 [Streptomyces umbrinus]
MRNRLQLLLQVMLVLVASLLGIVTNYATNENDVPWLLHLLQQVAIPAIGLLIVTMVVVQVVVYRLENPAPPPTDWPRDRVPYPGLDAFVEDEAAVFFGRRAQSEDLTHRLHAVQDRPADRFLVLVGASGSGKSSLVRAGVMPRLRGRRWSVLPAFSPGPNPLGALASAIATAGGEPESVNAVLRRLRLDPTALLAELSGLRGGRFRRMLLVVDQFEEVITLAGERERTQFLDALHACVTRDSRIRVLATLRVDFLGQLLGTDHAELFQHPVAIGALGRSQLGQAVEQPGTLVGLSFAPGVVEAIVNDAGTDDALPLLAYLLQELYFASGPGEMVTEELYHRLGGVAGALARQADHTVAELGAEGDSIDFVLRVLLRFVTVQGQEVARRRVPLAELTAQERRVVDAFVEARLLMSDVRVAQEPYAQVTHEALFRQWAPLRQEVEARAEQLRQRAELEQWAEDWERSGRSADYLLTGERLTLAQRWLLILQETGQAAEATQSLVESSQRHDLAFLRRVSDSIGQYALGAVEQQPEQSLLLTLAALGECTPTAAARRGLMTALASSHLRTQLDGHTDTVRHIAWSPNGLLLATASRDGTARVFDAQSGRSLRVLPSEGAMVEGVAWSPDSTQIATVGRDHVVRIWDAASGEPLRLLTGASYIGRQVAWSPNGRWIAGTSRDQTVRVWAANTGDLVHELHGHHDDVWGIAWSPDSTRLASASHDQTALVWDLSTGTSVTTLTGHSDFVEGIAWSPDGRLIATGSGDHTVRIFDAESGALRLLVRGHTDYVWNVAWSPDGQMLASASSDQTVRIVDAHDARVIAVLRGHTDTVWGVTWSPSGGQLATSSTDGTGRVWDLRPHGAESLLLDGHRGPVNQAAWSRDDTRIATASDDGIVRVWDAATGALSGPVVEQTDRVWSAAWSPLDDRLAISTNDGVFRIVHTSQDNALDHRGAVVESVAWSPDGNRIATGDHDGTVRVWSSQAGAELSSLAGHQDWINRIAWSSSGRLLASASDDRTCRLWDVAECRQLTVLRGHDNYVDDVAWSPDEQRIATASGDWTAAVWNTTTGRHIESLKGHEGRVRAIDWSPDGRLIATGSDDRTVRIWSSATFEEIAIVGVHQDKVASVAWSRDGTRLLTASFDGTARVWPADPDFNRLEAGARGRVFRVLSDDERRHHMLPLAR